MYIIAILSLELGAVNAPPHWKNSDFAAVIKDEMFIKLEKIC